MPFSKTSADPHPVPGSRLGLGGAVAAGDSHLLWLSSMPISLSPAGVPCSARVRKLFLVEPFPTDLLLGKLRLNTEYSMLYKSKQT